MQFSQHDMVTMREHLCVAYPSLVSKSGVHSVGKLLLDNSNKVVPDILFDSGSLSANYVSSTLVDSIRDKLRGKIRTSRRKIHLAAKDSAVETSEEVELTFVFKHPNDHCQYRYTGHFIILEMEGNNVIIGLPTILHDLYEYFLSMLRTARENYATPSAHQMLQMIAEGDIVLPWSAPIDKEAPEEDLVPEPQSFINSWIFHSIV
jgi:hypothetical protein